MFIERGKMNISKISNFSFKASFNNIGKQNTKGIEKSYDKQINTLESKKAIAKNTFECLNSKTIQKKIAQLPKKDAVNFYSLTEKNTEISDFLNQNPYLAYAPLGGLEEDYLEINTKDKKEIKAIVSNWLDTLSTK